MPPEHENRENVTAEDRAELDLLERLTLLEDWREHVEPAISLLIAGLLALAVAGLLTTITVRKLRAAG